MSDEVSRILRLAGILKESKEIEDECDMMQEEEDEYSPPDMPMPDDVGSEDVTITLPKSAVEWLKDHLSTEPCEGDCEVVQDAIEEALCPECDDDEASDELEDDLGLEESAASESQLAKDLIVKAFFEYFQSQPWASEEGIAPRGIVHASNEKLINIVTGKTKTFSQAGRANALRGLLERVKGQIDWTPKENKFVHDQTVDNLEESLDGSENSNKTWQYLTKVIESLDAALSSMYTAILRTDGEVFKKLRENVTIVENVKKEINWLAVSQTAKKAENLDESEGSIPKVDLEATHLRDSKWAVRPSGQLGTMGWHPFPWEVVYVTARNEEDAIRKARSRFDAQVTKKA